MCSTQFIRGHFRQADVAHLALLDELRHRAHALLDGHLRVGPVQVVQVNRLDAQTLQGCVAGLQGVLRPPVGGLLAPVILAESDAGDTELRCQLYLRAALGQQGGQHFFVRPGWATDPVVGLAVDVGSVEQGDASVDRFVEGSTGLVVGSTAVDRAQCHAPEPDRGGREGAQRGHGVGPSW